MFNKAWEIVAVSKSGKVEKKTLNACKLSADTQLIFFPLEGPIYQEMSSTNFVNQFMTKVCELKVDNLKSYSKKRLQDCDKKWTSSFLARLQVTYKFADTKYVRLQCEAYPMECNAKQMEIWAAKSHETESRVIAAEARKQLYFESLQLEALLRATASTAPNAPVYCNSMPNMMGGFRTTCH